MSKFDSLRYSYKMSGNLMMQSIRFSIKTRKLKCCEFSPLCESKKNGKRKKFTKDWIVGDCL